MTDKCKSCYYSCPVSIYEKDKAVRACQYILLTGKRRPCPGGVACTEYVPRKGKNAAFKLF